MNTCDVITGAKKVLDKEERWVKHTFKLGVGDEARFCLLGACQQAAADLVGIDYEHAYQEAFRDDSRRLEAQHEVSQAELALGETLDTEHLSVSDFNDADDTMFEDVQKLLDATERRVCYDGEGAT